MAYQELTTPDATFRFLYRIEGEEGWRRDLPPEFDAVFIEVMHARPVADRDQRLAAYIHFLETSSDLSILRSRVKENRSRVYFGDVADHPFFSVGHDTGILVVQGLLGLGLWFRGGRFLLARKRLRHFGWRVLITVLAGVWLMAGLLELAGYGFIRAPGKIAASGIKGTWLSVTNRLSNLHPEKPLVFFRNLVMAEKILEMAQLEKKESGKKPHIVLDFHYGHAGILHMLRWRPALRRFALRVHQPFLQPLLADPVQADYVARLISVRWSGSDWRQERSFKVDPLEFSASQQLPVAARG